MELWIRTQNKGALIKVEMVGNTDGIIHSYSGIIKTVLGEYKSNERALEVLDEIHQRLINLGTIEIAPDSYIVLPKDTSNVYEMPEE
jgi:hypothetical protein